jgi:hypothetical protein
MITAAQTIMGRTVKPPHNAARVSRHNHQLVGYALLIWQLVGGSAYLLLSTLHVAINGTIAAQRRAIELRARPDVGPGGRHPRVARNARHDDAAADPLGLSAAPRRGGRGRAARHQWLSSRPALPPALLVEEAAGARLEQEIAPYAEFPHHEMLDRVIH